MPVYMDNLWTFASLTRFSDSWLCEGTELFHFHTCIVHVYVQAHTCDYTHIKCSALISCEEWILVNKGPFPSLIIFPSSKRERVNSSSFFRRGRKTGTQTSCAVWECVYKRVCGVLCDCFMCPDLLVHLFNWNFLLCDMLRVTLYSVQ